MKQPSLALSSFLAACYLLAPSQQTLGDAAANNRAPWISRVGGVTLGIEQNSEAIPFTIGDAETPADSLLVSATSFEPTLIWGGVEFAGQGTNRWLMVRAGSVSGDAFITISVTDPAGASASATFKLTVQCDGGPTVSSIPDQYAMAGITTPAIPFWLNTCHGDVGNWTIEALASDTNLIPNDQVLVFRTGASGRLLLTPARGRTGSAMITLVVTGSEQQASTTKFALHVESGRGPVALTSEPEAVTTFPDQTIMLDAGVTSSTPPVFQWFKGTSELHGRTNSFLIVTNVQASDAGPYQLQILTDTETVTTRFVELHVRAPVSLSFPIVAADGSISTKVFGERGDRYSLFAGSSLGAWQQGTTITNEVGWAEYREEPGSAERFYRAILLP